MQATAAALAWLIRPCLPVLRHSSADTISATEHAHHQIATFLGRCAQQAVTEAIFQLILLRMPPCHSTAHFFALISLWPIATVGFPKRSLLIRVKSDPTRSHYVSYELVSLAPSRALYI